MRVTKAAVTRTCAICERTLLMGERALRFSPDGHDYVDVCPLCQELAIDHGWVKEGAPTTPVLAPERRRRGRPSLARLLAPRRQAVPAPVASAPILRRLSEPEQGVSIVRLSGTSGELVVTVAWEISWYQYRVSPESLQPVRLAERGHDPGELEHTFTHWNAKLDEDGRVVPDIARV
jgi:hypothetical protein